MNYRHAYHAGNFADVMKHALLVRLLLHLRRKETPFRVIDTHAGLGLYDLTAEKAEKTGEWRAGVGRMAEAFEAPVEALLEPYRAVIADVRARHGETFYPGSPAIVRELLRSGDRAVFNELHPRDGAKLAALYAGATAVKVLHLDAWTALHAVIPPRERRGLVLVDPPYEETGELERLGAELLRAVRKWETGVFAAWYPIKDIREIDRVAGVIARESSRPALRLEILVDRPDDGRRLNGAGLFVVNPPWTLAEEAAVLLPALAERLSRGTYAAFRCEPIGPKP